MADAPSTRARGRFDRALSRAFWRRLESLFTGSRNQLLPFEEVRRRLPIHGQRALGLRQVPIDRIVGSVGRFRDFDRAFFPTQTGTRDRWLRISDARDENVPLPPVDLYRLGDIYFVKDGNHRVSVARERGQEFLDAYVIEIDVPVSVPADAEIETIGLEDIDLARARIDFLEATRLAEIRPDVALDARAATSYPQLLEHLRAHHWFSGQKLDREIPWEEAVTSWLDDVYLPIVELVREQGFDRAFPRAGDVELYLWITTYQDFLRAASRAADDRDPRARRRDLPAPLRKVARLLRRGAVRQRLLDIGYGLFVRQTGLDRLRPDVDLRATLHHAYTTLYDQIEVHRWYLGEEYGGPVPYSAAAVSWVDQVYAPIVDLIREQQMLEQLPERTETDLYLWIQERRERARDAGAEMDVEVAAEQAVVDAEEGTARRMLRRLGDATRRVIE
ncbi:MAG: hypothetical protein AAGC60_15160 [Acidobacteriota bacterium]